jgi:hypothetical protein
MITADRRRQTAAQKIRLRIPQMSPVKKGEILAPRRKGAEKCRNFFFSASLCPCVSALKAIFSTVPAGTKRLFAGWLALLLILLASGFAIISPGVTRPVSAAANVTMTFAPLQTSVMVGEHFTVTITVQTIQAVDGAVASIHFDPAALQVESISPGNVLPIRLQSKFDNVQGSVNFAAGILSSPFPVSDFALVSVTFIAGTLAGNTPLTFVRLAPMTNDVTFGGVSILGAMEDGAVIIQPLPTATNTPSSTPTATNTPSSTPTATNTPSSTPTATNSPTNTPTATATPSPTATPTSTPSTTPTSTPLHDLLSSGEQIWTDPLAPRQGSAVELRVQVSRHGGNGALQNVTVRFYTGDQEPLQEIGSTIVRILGPDETVDTEKVVWTPAQAGSYTLWARIDPDNTWAESDETNNLVSRTLTVLPPALDSTPPSMTSLLVNGGAGETTTRVITLEATAVDSGGNGLASILYGELLWNSTAQRWIVEQWSDWMAYGASHAWTVSAAPGLRYIQAFAADHAGNISPTSAKAMINFMLPQDSLLAGETRIYRRWVEAGQCLSVTVSPQQGDADLYVWPPDYSQDQTYWYSLNGGSAVDAVQLPAPVTGNYQVEVEGFTDTTFALDMRVGASCESAPTSGMSTSGKTPREYPVVGSADEPPGQSVAPPPPPPTQTPPGFRLFLPAIDR